MDVLALAKRQLEENKNLLVEKNEELSDLNFRLEYLREIEVIFENISACQLQYT